MQAGRGHIFFDLSRDRMLCGVFLGSELLHQVEVASDKPPALLQYKVPDKPGIRRTFNELERLA
jgi:hypothetical protein